MRNRLYIDLPWGTEVKEFGASLSVLARERRVTGSGAGEDGRWRIAFDLPDGESAVVTVMEGRDECST